jgi:hypothetical protein
MLTELTELQDTDDVQFHRVFQQWRSQYPSRTFLTLATQSKANAHGAACSHLGSTDLLAEEGHGRNSLTRSLKVLDDGDPRSLNRWAQERSVAIHLCQGCLREGFIDESFFSETPGAPHVPGAESEAVAIEEVTGEVSLREDRLPNPLPPVVASRKQGAEPLHVGGLALPVDLLAFWQWSASDLVSNVTRGRLAEFIVATALGSDVAGVRNDWDSVDLTTPSGLKIEVKSAAHLQSWFQARLSNITFQTPKTRAWDPATNLLSEESRRQADVYVLALLHHQDKLTVDPLDLAQWSFYVLPTHVLDGRERSQHSISLASLRALVSPVGFAELAASVDQAGIAQLALGSR